MEQKIEQVEVDREEFFGIIKFVFDKYFYQATTEINEWLSPTTYFFYFEDKLLGYASLSSNNSLGDMITGNLPEGSEFYLVENLYERFKEELRVFRETQSSG